MVIIDINDIIYCINILFYFSSNHRTALIVQFCGQTNEAIIQTMYVFVQTNLIIGSNDIICYPAKPSYSHCVKLGRTDDHFSTAARVKKTVTPPTDKTVTVLALVS